MTGKKPRNGKRNGNGRKNGNGKKSPTVKRPMGAPSRKWTAAEMAMILDMIRSCKSVAEIAREVKCCRMTAYKLFARPDFVDAYKEARGARKARLHDMYYSEALGGRPIVRTVVETDCEGRLSRTTVTHETAPPNIGAASKLMAALYPDEWSDRATVKHEGDVCLFSLRNAGAKEAKTSA